MTAQIYQLTRQIPLVQSDLELQKNRREIEGARRVEKHLRALESEKSKLENQLVSYNQLLGPQRGEEFVHYVGEAGFLFLDLRSTRLEPGGSQAADNDLLSDLQWEFIEKSLASDSIRLWIVCSELPVVDESVEEPTSTALISPAVAPDFKTWWGRNPESQTRLLEILFDWKMEQSDREFVLLSGASGIRFGGTTSVKDSKLRAKADQHIVGAITAAPYVDRLHFTPRKPWMIRERFEVEHREVMKEKMYATLILNACSAEAKSSSSTAAKMDIQITHISARQHAHEMAQVLLGPVVGFVDASSAVVLLEIDRSSDVICIITNPLTGEMRKVYQRFEEKTPSSFYLTHLRPEHYYQISFENIQDANRFQASFSTPARFPTRFELIALCNDDLVSVPRQRSCVDDDQGAILLWGAIADKVVNVPFSGINLTVHLGGQFSANDSVFVEEALVLADASSSSAELTDALIVDKLRQMYRFSWNLPGVRETLCHGAHILLTNSRDDISLTGLSVSDLWVRQLLRRVHQEYYDLLLPPTKRVQAGRSSPTFKAERKRALSHLFGAFGLFVLPIGDFGGVTVDRESWDALEAFLSSPGLSVLLLVTEEPVVDHSFEDVLARARFDVEYTCKFGFYREELMRLLGLLFEWKRAEQSSQNKREVVFVSGSSYHSFDSVIEEVAPPPRLASRLDGTLSTPDRSTSSEVILQYVVGPMRRLSSLAETTVALEQAMLLQGTLSNSYAYHHFVSKKANHRTNSEGDEEPHAPEIPSTPLVAQDQSWIGDSASTVGSQIAQLMLSLDEKHKDSATTEFSRAVSTWTLVCSEQIESSDALLSGDVEKRYCREGRVNACQVSQTTNEWKLAPTQPSWLEEVRYRYEFEFCGALDHRLRLTMHFTQPTLSATLGRTR